MMKAALSGLALVVMCGSSAAAGDCPIELAIYREDELSSELRFFAGASENSPVTHKFTLVAGKTEADGQIYYDPEIERPVSVIMKNCPEGDVTGADLAACTAWKGIIHGINKATAHVDLLPPEGA